jgi:D-alanine-D-alanine ligase
MSKHVAVLMGGWSSEREVSLVSGKAVGEALRQRGYRVTLVDVDRGLAATLAALKPDAAFNALHGRFGEDGTVQGLLEVLGIPYTHSGVLASAVAMDKPMAKRLFKDAGLPLAEGGVMHREDIVAGKAMAPPVVFKPTREGSSVGVRVVLAGDDFNPATDIDWSHGDQMLVERYIPGHEIHVAVMGDRALGAVEIKPKGRFYDYESKYTAGRAEHLMPAPLPPADYAEALRVALLAHRTLGCRGVSRADMRYDDSGGRGRFYLLEVNTQPGMTPLSLVPEIAAHQGVPFADLVAWLVEDAGCDR